MLRSEIGRNTGTGQIMSDDKKMSRNRREQSIKIDDIKGEIERERAKMAAKAAEPEADIKPEDLVLFKDRAAKKAKAEADALTAKQVEAERIQAEKAAKKAAKLAKKQGLEPEKIEPTLATTDDGTRKPLANILEPLGEDSGDKKFEKLDTDLRDNNTGLQTVEQPGMSWNKFWKMGRAKKTALVLGVGLPVLAVIGAALWFTRGWREWTGNLVVFSVPLLIILTYVMDHLAQDKYWEDFRGSKALSRANRQDAAIVIPLILFMAGLSLNSDMFLMDGIIHFLRFVLIGTVVWAGLIWLTRKVPPIRKIVGEE
jgi:hypothetical protein